MDLLQPCDIDLVFSYNLNQLKYDIVSQSGLATNTQAVGKK